MRLTLDQQHERMRRPYDPRLDVNEEDEFDPAPIPAIWERVRLMFSRLIAEFGSPSKFSTRARVRCQTRKEWTSWIAPIESLVRGLLLAEASLFLLSKAGEKLWRTARRLAMPESRPRRIERQSASVSVSASVSAPADPGLPAPIEAPPSEAADACDPNDASKWSCPFRVLGWRFPESDPGDSDLGAGPAQPAEGAGGKSSLMSPLMTARPRPLTPIERARLAHLRACEAHRLAAQRNLPGRLARRMEAVGRILANPQPYIQRTARLLARLPREAITVEGVCCARKTWRWRDGNDARRALWHHLAALIERLLAIPPEGQAACALPAPEPG
jgi:hypothetical protein